MSSPALLRNGTDEDACTPSVGGSRLSARMRLFHDQFLLKDGTRQLGRLIDVVVVMSSLVRMIHGRSE